MHGLLAALRMQSDSAKLFAGKRLQPGARPVAQRAKGLHRFVNGGAAIEAFIDEVVLLPYGEGRTFFGDGTTHTVHEGHLGIEQMAEKHAAGPGPGSTLEGAIGLFFGKIGEARMNLADSGRIGARQIARRQGEEGGDLGFCAHNPKVNERAFLHRKKSCIVGIGQSAEATLSRQKNLTAKYAKGAKGLSRGQRRS